MLKKKYDKRKIAWKAKLDLQKENITHAEECITFIQDFPMFMGIIEDVIVYTDPLKNRVVEVFIRLVDCDCWCTVLTFIYGNSDKKLEEIAIFLSSDEHRVEYCLRGTDISLPLLLLKHYRDNN